MYDKFFLLRQNLSQRIFFSFSVIFLGRILLSGDSAATKYCMHKIAELHFFQPSTILSILLVPPRPTNSVKRPVQETV